MLFVSKLYWNRPANLLNFKSSMVDMHAYINLKILSKYIRGRKYSQGGEKSGSQKENSVITIRKNIW